MNNSFKYSVSTLRVLVALRRAAFTASLLIVLAGIPYVILSWMVGAYMCGAGNGPDTSYCM